MKRSTNFVFLVDFFLVVLIIMILFMGCVFNQESNVQSKIAKKHRAVFRVYNTEQLLFAPDVTTHNTKPSKASHLPNITLIVSDIPPTFEDLDGLLNAHYSIALGFLPDTSIEVLNKAMYNGHKLFLKITVSEGQDSTIDLTRSTKENITRINYLLSNTVYDGLYISMDDIKAIKRFPELLNKVHETVTFASSDESICYQNRICYLNKGADVSLMRNTFAKISKLSEDDGQWILIIQYQPDIHKILEELLLQ